MFTRGKMAQVVAEFLATSILVLVVLSVSFRSNFPLFTAISAGLVLAMMVLAIGPISGAHANPAITFGLWTRRLVSTKQMIANIVAQLLAGAAVITLYQYLIHKEIQRPSATFDWRVLIAEALGAFVFGFGVFAAVKRKLVGGLLAAAVGGSLTLGILVASIGSLGAINPAVALGIDSFSRAYIIGPLLGSALGMASAALLLGAAAPKKKKK